MKSFIRYLPSGQIISYETAQKLPEGELFVEVKSFDKYYDCYYKNGVFKKLPPMEVYERFDYEEENVVTDISRLKRIKQHEIKQTKELKYVTKDGMIFKATPDIFMPALALFPINPDQEVSIDDAKGNPVVKPAKYFVELYQEIEREKTKKAKEVTEKLATIESLESEVEIKNFS